MLRWASQSNRRPCDVLRLSCFLPPMAARLFTLGLFGTIDGRVICYDSLFRITGDFGVTCYVLLFVLIINNRVALLFKCSRPPAAV